MSPAAETLRQVEVRVKSCPECGSRFGIDSAFCPFDGHALAPSTWDRSQDVRIGQRIAERYAVVEPIGEGGMGTVYKVRHLSLDRAFAMKVLRRDLARDAELAQRFVNEAKVTARIRHPAVVAITDFGTLEDGVPWFVMELLEGATLAAELRAKKAFPPDRIAALGRRIADGLAASHAAGVIHRDLKPENVFVVGDEVRIVDFGAAKVLGASALTRPGIVFGTPYYMAPEQVNGEPVDARTDVYALGVLLYELATGHVPFEADSYMGVLSKHLYEAPASPHASAGGPLAEVIVRALAKAPADRWASMEELSRALGALAAGVPTPIPERRAVTGIALGEPSAADRLERSVARHVAAESRRIRRLVAFAVIGACGVLALAGGIVALAPAAPPPAPATVRAPDPEPAPPPAEARLPLPEPPPEPPSAAEPQPPPPPRAEPPRHPRPAAIVSAAPPATVPTAPATAHVAGPDEFKDPWK